MVNTFLYKECCLSLFLINRMQCVNCRKPYSIFLIIIASNPYNMLCHFNQMTFLKSITTMRYEEREKIITCTMSSSQRRKKKTEKKEKLVMLSTDEQ